jgi:deoxyribonuclease IV
MARTKENLENLFNAVGHSEVGFCLDTCHAWAGGWQMESLASDVLAITKRIDLVHANGSKDKADSGRDRHDNFETSLLPKDLILKTVKESKANSICETNLDLVHQDVEYLRKNL